MVGRPGGTRSSHGPLSPLIVIGYLYILDDMLKGKLVPALMVVIVVMAFGLGAMWSRLRTLGQASQATQAPQAQQATVSKYKSFEEAMRSVAEAAGVKDVNRLISCLNSDEKKAMVDTDTAEGTKLGVSGTPAFFINGRLLAGAYPFEEFKKIIDEELAGKTDAKLDRAQVTVGSAPVRGKSGAQITLVEYSDFQCPFCLRAAPTVKQVLQEYEGKILFAYKHFPLTGIHPRAQKTAEAAECARDQGKFWEFHDSLFQTQSDWASL